jgi:hypothetical protein
LFGVGLQAFVEQGPVGLDRGFVEAEFNNRKIGVNLFERAADGCSGKVEFGLMEFSGVLAEPIPAASTVFAELGYCSRPMDRNGAVDGVPRTLRLLRERRGGLRGST